MHICVTRPQWVNALVPGRFGCDFLSRFTTCNWSLQIMALDEWSVNIGSDNCLIPSGNKSLLGVSVDPVLCHHTASLKPHWVNILKHEQKATFSVHLLDRKYCSLIQMSLNFVADIQMDDKSALFQAMSWYRTVPIQCLKPCYLSLLMYTAICITRPQRVLRKIFCRCIFFQVSSGCNPCQNCTDHQAGCTHLCALDIFQRKFRRRSSGYLSWRGHYSWWCWIATPSTTPHSLPRHRSHPLSFILRSPHKRWGKIDGLVQERCNSSALAMELRLSCTNPSKCWVT